MKKSSPLFIAFLTVAIDLLGFGIVIPLLPLYAELLTTDVPREYHGLVIGLLMSSFSAMQFLFAPAWGRLSDRIGRRPVLMIGLAGSVIFYTLFGLASIWGSLFWVFVSRIGAGIAGATIGTAQAVIADSTTPEKRARGMALIGMAFGVGFTLGPLIGTLVLWSGSDGTEASLSPLPGFVAAVLSLGALVLAAFRLPETRPAGGLPPRPWFNLDGWRLALGHRTVAVPLLTFFVATLAFGTFEGTVARFLKAEMHLELWEMGLVFAYIGLVLMLTQGFIVRRLVTRTGEVVMCIVGIVLMLGGLLAIGVALSIGGMGSIETTSLPAQWWVFLLLTMAVAVAGFACITPSAQALVSRRSSALRQGEVLGVNQAAAAIARIVGPLMGNILYGSQQSPQPAWPFYAAGGLLLVALALAVTMRQDPTEQQPA